MVGKKRLACTSSTRHKGPSRECGRQEKRGIMGAGWDSQTEAPWAGGRKLGSFVEKKSRHRRTAGRPDFRVRAAGVAGIVFWGVIVGPSKRTLGEDGKLRNLKTAARR